MKHTISNLAKFADQITEKKFRALSSKKQHEVIASYALLCIKESKFDQFKEKYELFHSWAELDRFRPNSWLSRKEKLASFYQFHISYTPNPPLNDLETSSFSNIEWTHKFNLSLYLDEIRSPYNIGSILRIADNFGLKEVVHSNLYTDIKNPGLKKTSMGAYRWIPLKYENNPCEWLKKSGCEVVGLEKSNDSEDISQWKPEKNCIIIAGNEETGISEKILSCCDKTVHIPMHGFKNSMNVSHAVSVLCYKFSEFHKNNF